MKPDNEHRPWKVLMPDNNGSKVVASYRLRNDAESHCQQLKRLLPDGGFTVVFEQPKISLR